MAGRSFVQLGLQDYATRGVLSPFFSGEIELADALHRSDGGVERGDDAAAFRADHEIAKNEKSGDAGFTAAIDNRAFLVEGDAESFQEVRRVVPPSA